MDLRQCIGLGVAGNFANHLEQAGEMRDFMHVQAKEGAPKGIFPFYLPHTDSFLQVFPLSSTEQSIAGVDTPQVEPEVALLCDIDYHHGQVVAIRPQKFAAFNDCTVRREGAAKISEKKNWGPSSKGVSDTWLELDRFTDGGRLDHYRLASFVKRDGQLHPYGVDTPVRGYSYFYAPLMQWLIEQLNTQQDTGPLENMTQLLADNQYPTQAIISIGATAYEAFGEKNYLQSGDEIFVVVYPDDVKDITQWLKDGQCPPMTSLLKQQVV